MIMIQNVVAKGSVWKRLHTTRLAHTLVRLYWCTWDLKPKWKANWWMYIFIPSVCERDRLYDLLLPFILYFCFIWCIKFDWFVRFWFDMVNLYGIKRISLQDGMIVHYLSRDIRKLQLLERKFKSLDINLMLLILPTWRELFILSGMSSRSQIKCIFQSKMPGN